MVQCSICLWITQWYRCMELNGTCKRKCLNVIYVVGDFIHQSCSLSNSMVIFTFTKQQSYFKVWSVHLLCKDGMSFSKYLFSALLKIHIEILDTYLSLTEGRKSLLIRSDFSDVGLSHFLLAL